MSQTPESSRAVKNIVTPGPSSEPRFPHRSQSGDSNTHLMKVDPELGCVMLSKMSPCIQGLKKHFQALMYNFRLISWFKRNLQVTISAGHTPLSKEAGTSCPLTPHLNGTREQYPAEEVSSSDSTRAIRPKIRRCTKHMPPARLTCHKLL